MRYKKNYLVRHVPGGGGGGGEPAPPPPPSPMMHLTCRFFKAVPTLPHPPDVVLVPVVLLDGGATPGHDDCE